MRYVIAVFMMVLFAEPHPISAGTEKPSYYVLFLGILVAGGFPEDAGVSGPYTATECKRQAAVLQSQAKAPPGYELQITCDTKYNVDVKLGIFNCRHVETLENNYSYKCYDPRAFYP